MWSHPVANDESTVVSEMGEQWSDHTDHVSTQLPYAMLGGIAAILICTLPAGYGLPWWLLLPTAAVAVFSTHRFLGKRADEAPPLTEPTS